MALLLCAWEFLCVVLKKYGLIRERKANPWRQQGGYRVQMHSLEPRMVLNAAPIADSSWPTIDEDSNLTVGGYDPDNDPLTAIVVSGPSNGATNVNSDGTVTYTPNANFNGSDSFQFKVNDGLEDSSVATVTITLNPINDTPWANDDSWTVLVPHQHTEPVGFTNVSSSAYGDVDGDSLNFNYNGTPPTSVAPGTSGSIVYSVSDPSSATASATLYYAVGYLENHAPVAENDTVTTDEDSSVSFDPRGNDSDEDGDSLGAPQIESGPANGTVSVNEFGTITYTPAANFNGSDAFTYRVHDGWGGSDTAIVTVGVNPVNDEPTATDSWLWIDEDTSFSVGGSDIDGDVLQAIVVNGPSNGTLTSGGPGTLVYTPGANYYGTDSFQYKVSDGQIESSVATVSISINSINDWPTAGDDNFELSEDGSVGFSVWDLLSNDSDVEGPVTFAGFSGSPANGQLFDHGGSYTYTPNPDFNGGDWLTYSVTDGTGVYASATVHFNVLSVADAPRPGDDAFALNEDESRVISIWELLSNDYDPDGDPLEFAGVVSGVSNGQLVNNGDGTLSYTPNADFNGADVFTYQVNDVTGLSATANVTLTVHPVNDAPVVSDEVLTINEDSSLTVGGYDVDGDVLTAYVVTNPANGTLAFNYGGTITYTPSPDFFGSDSFAYYVSDGGLQSGWANVSVTINSVNDAPTFTPGEEITLDEDAAPYSATWATDASVGPENESDQVPAYVVVNNNHSLFTAGGQPAIAPDGTLTFTPAPNAYGAAQVTVRLTDNGGVDNGGISTSPPQTFNISLEPVNDPPQNILPTPRTMVAGTNLVFRPSNGNTIAVQDDSVLPIQVMLVVSEGSLSLSQTTGLTFLTGDGTQDWFVCFTGTVSNINAALNGLTFHAPAGYLGNVDLTMATQDLGGTGQGVPLADFDVLKIRALPLLSVTDQVVNEPDGSVTFTLSLSQASSEVITVDFATSDGTAGPGDYSGGSGTVTFEPGETSHVVTIGINDDTEIELDEDFHLTLSNPVNVLLEDDDVIGTIVSEDAAELTVDDVTVNEDAGTAVVTIRLNRGDHLGVSLDFATADGSATSPEDYLGGSGHIDFAPGETEKSVTLTVVDDLEDESDETFRLAASNVSGANVVKGQGTVTIIDNDTAPELTVDDVSVHEDDGTATITFRLNHGDHPGVTFDFTTVEGSALNPEDYGETSGQISFATGEIEKTVTVPIVHDSEHEQDETFQIVATNVSNATVVDGESTVTILGDPELTIDDVTVGEGDGTVAVTFRLNRGDHEGVSVSYNTFNVTAGSPFDYVGGPGSLTFEPGETVKTVEIDIINDSWDEETCEKFEVEATSISIGIIADNVGVVTIVDNDLMGVVAYTAPPTIVENGETTLHGAIIADTTWGGYRYVIDWGDGTRTFGIVPQGQTDFENSHVYADDGPSPGNGTPADLYLIVVTAINPDDEENIGGTTVTVLNIDPTLEITDTTSSPVPEGGAFVVNGVAFDDGPNDVLTVTVLIDGDFFGSINVLHGVPFTLEIPAIDDGTYDVDIILNDDDTGEDSTSFSVTVENVDPEAGGGGFIGFFFFGFGPTEQEILDSVFLVHDPGIADTHEKILLDPIPDEVGYHEVWVMLIDDDGGFDLEVVSFEIILDEGEGGEE